MDILIIVLQSILIVIGAAALFILLKLNSKNSTNVRDELRVNREEISLSLSDVSEKLSVMVKENYESRISLSESMNDKLNTISTQSAQQNERQTAAVREAIEKMQQSNERKLDEMRGVVDEKLSKTLATRLDSSFKAVSEQLENVYKSLGEMKELSTGVTSLNKMLTNVKVRGNWAEYQLEDILDQTIPNMYVKNYSPSGKGERVEFAVKIPASQGEETIYLPIDSKFPIEDYNRLCDAAERADAAEATAARKALETRVLNEAKDISERYIKVPNTTPFAILYLATEGLYAEIASSKNNIIEQLHGKYSIMVAGPSTITALLNSLSVGFKTVAINEKANEIRKILGAVKTQYDAFEDILSRVKKQIETAGRTIDSAQTKNRTIRRVLKEVETIEKDESEDILGIE
ncbi:MAG TPA: DNA recombination protein RmuC [Oscillospiraceae bacterium]|nr:DNA recombination protein RmuC [Oscillospiraceae bacterium]